jgi:ABC-type branched-subunit amino acid transport system permease subunit
MIALVIGCFYAGVGGGLLIEFIGAINPSGWSAPERFIIFAALLVGGRANNLGTFLGCLLVPVILLEGTRFIPVLSDHPALISNLRFVIVGALLIVALWFRPQGLLPERKRFYEIPLARTSPEVAEAAARA